MTISVTIKKRLPILTTALIISACAAATPHADNIRSESNTRLTNSIELKKPAQVQYLFATAEQASVTLSTADEYTAELQPIEIGIKNKNASQSRLEDLQTNYREGTLEWTPSEQKILGEIVSGLQLKLRDYHRHLPGTVLMGKISDKVEGGLPHTRANLILFSQGSLDQYFAQKETNPEEARATLTSLFLHELHHVLSRHNSDKHDEYYALLGFNPCQFDEPAQLRNQRLTNPDAPSYKHYAPVTLEKGNGVIPYLSVSGPYDAEKGDSLGNYFQFGLLAVNAENGICQVTQSPPQLLSPGTVPDFFKLIGRNTGYIIHPEETLADNFTYLIMEREGLPDPQIPQKIGEFWNAQ